MIPKPKEFMMQPMYSQPYYPQNSATFNPFPQNPYAYGIDMPQQVIHNVHISTTGPNADHEQLAMIYEDALPLTKFITHSVTLYDRLNLYQFIRSTILKGRDGEDTSFDGSTRSLLTKLKFGELNPYGNKIQNNPYYELPNDYLIYRSCYPIRMNIETSSTQCGKKSCGINVRIYKMDYGAMNVLKTKNIDDTLKYPQLRDIGYYEYIREEILKKQVCPNFVLMFGYFVSNEINIDFDKINKIRGWKGPKERKFQGGIGPDKKKTNVTFDNIRNMLGHISIDGLFDNTGKITATIKDPTIVERNDKYYENCGLIALTESGTYSIISWATSQYQLLRPNIKTMIYRGSHTDDEWLNIIFQIMVGLYVMIIKKIYIKNISLKRNIFIKDVDNSEIVKTYWKYIIDNVEYFVPNMKYVVMIDSDFQDELVSSTIKETKHDLTKIKCEKYFKPEPVAAATPPVPAPTTTTPVAAPTVATTPVATPTVATPTVATPTVAAPESISVDNYKEMINNILNPDRYKDIQISENTKKILTEIKNGFDSIEDYDKLKIQFRLSFAKYMYKYLHSRIGTVLTEKEVTDNGTSIVMTTSGYAYTSNEVVVVISKKDDTTAYIMRKLGIVSDELIRTFNKLTIQLNQPVKFGEPMRNEENLLETYEIKDE